jgi:hypothetical protein
MRRVFSWRNRAFSSRRPWSAAVATVSLTAADSGEDRCLGGIGTSDVLVARLLMIRARNSGLL